jgi:hypothetical protein
MLKVSIDVDSEASDSCEDETLTSSIYLPSGGEGENNVSC